MAYEEKTSDGIDCPELDEYEQDLEDDFENYIPIPEPEYSYLKTKLEQAAKNFVDRLNKDSNSLLKNK